MIDVAWAVNMKAFEGKSWEDLPDVIKASGHTIIDPATADKNYDGIVIPYGSIQWCGSVAKFFSNTMYPYSTLFKPSTMLARHHNIFLNGDAIWMPWGLLADRVDDDLGYGRYFIKPDTGNKTFTGFVWDSQAESRHSIQQTYKITAEDMIMMATEKQVVYEYRIFVIGGTVIDGSGYAFDDNIDSQYLPDAIAIVEGVKNRFYDDTYTIDVCLTSQNEWKIVEFNSVNSSGLYDIDKQKFVDAMVECAKGY